ncbi:DUF368 domain-containing protein [Anaerosphaera multitolerans]|uniref:DUF368 domain-containing protein n=2 Tax=Anaerosphaera multitolerans TaxID=2487351 RepID=A0A437S4P1_9FIRM|nr:DUF368 domain-containing protein [Anaerosphaera multitolerans]
MLVPGLSGSSMAIILGIYDKLILAVSSFMKHKRESFIFLSLFSLGALMGIFLFSNSIVTLLDKYPQPMYYLFIGAAIGGLPLIFKQSKIEKLSPKVLFYILVGLGIIYFFSLSVNNIRDIALEPGFLTSLILIVAGVIVAIALVLPGISISYMLLLIGLYDETIKAITEFYFPFLIPLGIGFIAGIILTAKALEKLITKRPQPTYLIISGFILGSVIEIFPGLPIFGNLFICIITFSLGLITTLLMSLK